uniref:Uncharacterized protein n=1 Tax=Leersia perrieri TaxID=77586 RepID=A0A0D9WUK8_9ORYZ
MQKRSECNTYESPSALGELLADGPELAVGGEEELDVGQLVDDGGDGAVLEAGGVVVDGELAEARLGHAELLHEVALGEGSDLEADGVGGGDEAVEALDAGGELLDGEDGDVPHGAVQPPVRHALHQVAVARVLHAVPHQLVGHRHRVGEQRHRRLEDVHAPLAPSGPDASLDTNCLYVVLYGTPIRSAFPLLGNTHPRGRLDVCPGQITLIRVGLGHRQAPRGVGPVAHTAHARAADVEHLAGPARARPVTPVKLTSVVSFPSSCSPWSNTFSAPSRSRVVLPLATSLASSEKVTLEPSSSSWSMARAAIHTASYANSPYAFMPL